MKSKEEEKLIQKVNKILEAKMKNCLAECKEEEMSLLQKVRYKTFKNIFLTINKPVK